MKRLAVHVAAEEVVAAYRDLRDHPSLEAEQRLEGSIALLSLRLDVHERRKQQAVNGWWGQTAVDELRRHPVGESHHLAQETDQPEFYPQSRA